MKVACIGAHPDDVELGMGGTIAKHVNMEDNIHIVICTLGGVSGDPQERLKEARKGASILGVDQVKIHSLDYPVSKLNEPSLQFQKIIQDELHSIGADRVYVHSPLDYHQVHVAVSQSTYDAMQLLDTKQIIFYEALSSTTSDFKPNAYVDITKYFDLKTRSMAAHSSQSKRLYMQPNVIRSLANIRYAREKIGMDPNGLAEAFYVSKLVF
jgi:LmbE family N-acetylglucosaminyl deacetylase